MLLTHRLASIVMICTLVVLMVAFSLLLLQSANLALGLFILTVVLVLLILEPFAGLLVYVLFIYTGPQAYAPALQNLRVILVIGGAAFASMLARRALAGSGFGSMREPQTLFVAWFLLAVGVSHLVYLEFGSAWESVLGILSHVVLYFLVVKLVTTQSRLRKLLAIMLLGTFVLAVQGVVQHFLGYSPLGMQEYAEGRIAGIGYFENPNMLAIGLVCGLPIAYIFTAHSNNLLLRAALVLGILVSLFALYLTNSRGGMLSLVVVIAFPLVRRLGVVRGLLLATLVFFAILQWGPSRMSTISATEASAQGRLLAWQKGLDIFASHPLFGAGAGSWYEKYRTLIAHNSLIHCAAELGIFGVLPWALMFLMSGRNLWYVFRYGERSSSPMAPLAGAVLLALCAFVFASMFISKTYNMFVFLLIGVSTATVNVWVLETGERFELMSSKELALGIVATLTALGFFKLFLIVLGY